MFGYWKSGRAIANNFQPSNISPVCDSAIAIESIVVFWFCIWHWNNVPDMPGIISVDVSFLRWVSWNLSWNVWPMVTIDIIWLYHESISQKQNVNARWDLTKQWAKRQKHLLRASSESDHFHGNSSNHEWLVVSTQYMGHSQLNGNNVPTHRIIWKGILKSFWSKVIMAM